MNGIFFSVHLHRSDPTEVTPRVEFTNNQPTLTVLLWIVVWSFDDDEKNTPTPYSTQGNYGEISAISEERVDLSSFFVFVFVVIIIIIIISERECTWFQWWFRDWLEKRISSIRNSSLISKCARWCSHKWVNAPNTWLHRSIPFCFSERRERGRDNDANKKMIQMNESWMIEPRDILTWQLQNVSWISLDTSGR